MSPLRVGAVADSDTRLKWSVAAAGLLARPELIAVVDSAVTPTARQLQDSIGTSSGVVFGSMSELVADQRFPGLDAVVVCTSTEALVSVRHELERAWVDTRRRPVLITGYAGLVYEHRSEGLSWRIGSDIICVNSASDERFALELFDAYGRQSQRVVRLGFPQFAASNATPSAHSDNRQLTFAAQPDVPARRADREYLLGRLVDHARENPSERVVVKLRSRPDERTTHPEPHHYEKLFRRLVPEASDRPDNLMFEYGAMGDVLDRTGLLVTVSSTAAAEAMARGIPTAIVSDLGIAERLGNHLFVGSGCLATFDQLGAGLRPLAVPSWTTQHGILDDGSAQLREQVQSIRREWGDDVPALPELLPHVQRRFIVRPDHSGLRGRARRVAQGSLRNVYSRLQTWASQ